MRKKIAILGATGSIGCQAIDVVKLHLDKYEVVLLTANTNQKLLESLSNEVDCSNTILTSIEGMNKVVEFIKNEEIDIVLSGIVGSSGISVSYETVKKGITLALANKESLVAAGPLIMGKARETGATVFPVDSEHSAILQALSYRDLDEVSKIVLTASGGSFRDLDVADLKNVSVKDALKHPNWSMGSKITIDSATMVNKGLELIEARYLFDFDHSKLDVILHNESIIHSYVCYSDGSSIAQMGLPDMKTPIGLALSYPNRYSTGVKTLDMLQYTNLTFSEVDYNKYPCLKLIQDLLKKDNNFYYIIVNAANEVAVENFLNETITFLDIYRVLEGVLNKMENLSTSVHDIESIYNIDRLARSMAQQLINNI